MKSLFIICAALVTACNANENHTVSTAKSDSQALLFASPWPKFRANMQQNGRSDVLPALSEAKVWSFKTSKGIFSSPVIGPEGNVYIGSADRNFYALTADGRELWNKPTGEIIDSSGLIAGNGQLYFGSGDGILRCVDSKSGSDCWSFAAEDPSKTGGLINWFEGNVAIGIDGTLYAPNDNFSLYALNPADGTQSWKYPLNDQSWSSPAIDPESGDLFFGSNYIAPSKLLQPFYKNIFSLNSKGKLRWRQTVQASVASSPLLSREGLIVVGAFDGILRAYDKKDGKEKWNFATQDHIYASPAELSDGTIIQASTDGNVYALNGRDGSLIWSFASGEPIRSSPAIDGEGHIYFGSGDGSLYVLNDDGTLRFRMQLIHEDRNDLNASPALGSKSVLIAGENGELWSIPYDYCLREDGLGDSRCSSEHKPAADGVRLSYLSPFGSLLENAPSELTSTQSLTLAISKLTKGHPAEVSFDESRLSIHTMPETPIDARVSGDGKAIVITPQTYWNGDSIKIEISAGYLEGGAAGTIEQALDFAVKAKAPFPSEAKNFVLRRLAVPVPAIMPSYNQIGFDSLSYVITVLEKENGKGTAWVMGGIEAADGTVTVDPKGEASFPLTWDENDRGLFMISRDGFSAMATNLKVPFSFFRLDLLSWTNEGGVVAALASTVCKDIPTYGYFLSQLGFCSPKEDRMTLAGAAELKPIDMGAPNSAEAKVIWSASKNWLGYATLEATLPNPEHALLSVVLIDAKTHLPLPVDYEKLKKSASGANTRLSLPYASGPDLIRSYALKGAAVVGTALWSRQANGVYQLVP